MKYLKTIYLLLCCTLALQRAATTMKTLHQEL